MDLPAFLVVNATPNNDENNARQRYQEQASKISARYGAVPVATYSFDGSLDESDDPKVCAVISFPSQESIHQLFADEEYQALIPIRDLGFSYLRYFIGTEQIK